MIGAPSGGHDLAYSASEELEGSHYVVRRPRAHFEAVQPYTLSDSGLGDVPISVENDWELFGADTCPCQPPCFGRRPLRFRVRVVTQGKVLAAIRVSSCVRDLRPPYTALIPPARSTKPLRFVT